MNRRWKILIAFGIVLGVAILIPVIHHYQLRAATEAYIIQLKAQGEPLELAQVIPPPVPPEQNGAPLITNAIYHLKEDCIASTNYLFAMHTIAPGRAMIGWQQSEIRGPDATNTWQELAAELADANNNLIQLRNLTVHPILDFNLNYGRGWSMPIPHLSKLKRTAQWLDASALYNLHQGKPTDACADVHAMLAIVKGETEERTTISQLVRIAIAQIGANATWEILQATNVSDEALAQLQQDWQSPEFIVAYEHTLLWERVAAMLTFNQIRQSDFKKLFIPVRGRWTETKWDLFWSYKDEIRGLQAFQVVIDATRMAETNNSFQPVQTFVHKNFVRLNLEKENGGTQMTNDLNLNDEAHVMFASSAYASFPALRKIATMETWQNVVVTAIALKRYELRHHQLPATLDALIPIFLNSVPTDCMDGESLRYKLNADGTFLLYSIGEDGVDDGGDPSPQQFVTTSTYYWFRGRDWVWPQPATEQEIQSYYAHPPK